jgi:hypothetical protein
MFDIDDYDAGDADLPADGAAYDLPTSSCEALVDAVVANARRALLVPVGQVALAVYPLAAAFRPLG